MAAVISKQLSPAALVLISTLTSMAIGVLLYFVASVSHHAHLLHPSALSMDNDNDDNDKKTTIIIFVERVAIAMMAMPVVIGVCGVAAIVGLRKLHIYDGYWLLKPLLAQYCRLDVDKREDVEEPFVYGSSTESDDSTAGSPRRSNKYEEWYWYGQRRSLSMNDMEKATGLMEGVGSLMDGEIDIKTVAFCCEK